MTRAYPQIPIHESPWVRYHAPQDVLEFSRRIAGMGNALANLMQSEATTYDQFVTGAVNELDALGVGTRAHKKTRKSSFRFSDQKDGDVTVILMAENTRLKAGAKLFEWVVSNAQKEWVRHPNKKKRVTLFLNEISNIHWKDLESLFSWCRAYGLRIKVYIQNYFGFERQNGKAAREMLESESEITLYLPNQRHRQTLIELEQALGNTSYTSVTNSGKRDGGGVSSYNISEESKPLMSRQKLRQLKGHGVLFLGNNKPALVKLHSVASVWPFRHRQAISPFYNKKYRERITLILWRYAPFMPAVLLSKLKTKIRKTRARKKETS